jgi:hypothetical protein
MNNQTLVHRKRLKDNMNYLLNGYTNADKGYLPKQMRRARNNSDLSILHDHHEIINQY